MKHENIQAHSYAKHVGTEKHRSQIWIGMVGDRLDCVRLFGCRLEMGERGCTWVCGFKMSRSGLNISGNG